MILKCMHLMPCLLFSEPVMSSQHKAIIQNTIYTSGEMKFTISVNSLLVTSLLQDFSTPGWVLFDIFEQNISPNLGLELGF